MSNRSKNYATGANTSGLFAAAWRLPRPSRPVFGAIVLCGIFIPSLAARGGLIVLDDYNGTNGICYSAEGSWGRDCTLNCWTGGTAGVSGPEHSYAACDLSASIPGWSLGRSRNNTWCGWMDLNHNAVSGWGAASYSCGMVLAADRAEFNNAATCGYAVGFRNSDDRLTIFRFSAGIVSGTSELPGASASIVAGYAYADGDNGVNFLVRYLPDGRWNLCWKAGPPLDPESAREPVNHTDGSVTSEATDATYAGVSYRYAGWAYAHSTFSGGKSFFDNLGAGLDTMDSDSSAEPPGEQITAANLSSLVTNAASAVSLFRFRIVDSGAFDATATVVTNIGFRPAPANSADWSATIGGVLVSNITASALVDVGMPVISDDWLSVPVPPGALTIMDAASCEFAIHVYLNGSNLVDNSCLAFMVKADGHAFEAASGLGSDFANTFAADIVGNAHTVRVSATRLMFSGLPDAQVCAYSNFSLTVMATDANGNRDVDSIAALTLSLSAGFGMPAAVSGLSRTLCAGAAYWTDMRIESSSSDQVLLRAESPGLIAGVSDSIVVVEAARSTVALFRFDGDTVNPIGGHRHVAISPFTTDGAGMTAFPAGVNGLPDKAFRKTQWSGTDVTNQYFAFSVSVDPGYQLSLTRLEFNEQRSDSGPTNWTAWYSTNNIVFHEIDGGECSAGSWGATDVADDILPFMTTNTVHIRIFGTNAGSASGTWRVDNIALSGRTQVDRGYRVIRFQGFEEFDGMGNWACATVAGAGKAEASAGAAYTGRRSLLLAGSEMADSDPCVVFDNVDLAAWSDVTLGLAFAASGPDAGDDLWLELSYDNGTTWSWSNRLVREGCGVVLPFGATSEARPVTVASNPYKVSIPAGAAQVKARIRFDETAGTDNRGDIYRIDDILLTGLELPQPHGPALSMTIMAPGVIQDGQAMPMLHVTAGYPSPDVYLCSGVEDGGTDMSKWDSVVRFESLPRGVTGVNLGAQSAARSFYRAFVSNAYGLAWTSDTYALALDQRRPAGWHMVCVPAQWGRPWCNNLNSTLGEQLASGLAGGGAGPADSDALYVLADNTWYLFYLDAQRKWRNADDDSPADLEMRPGEGCWIKRHGGNAVTCAAMFGTLCTNSSPINLPGNSWSLFGWPYSSAMHESCGATDSEKGWGFGAAGGAGSYTERKADRILAFDGSTWRSGFMGEDQRWYVGGKPTNEANRLDMSLEPGRAYYYFRRGSNTVWTAKPQ